MECHPRCAVRIFNLSMPHKSVHCTDVTGLKDTKYIHLKGLRPGQKMKFKLYSALKVAMYLLTVGFNYI